MAKLGQYAVHLMDDAGVLHSFLPGDEVPGWAAKRMGSHCFSDDSGAVNIPPQRDWGGNVVSTGPPPRHGKGSGEDGWRAYAERHGVDVSSVDGRDEIIAACEDAGVPVE